MAVALQKHSISIGSYIANQMKANNFNDICSNMSTLSGEDFRAKVKAKRAEIVDNQLLLTEIAPDFERAFFSSLKKVFDYRHMFCHELAPIMTAQQYSEIKSCFTHSYTLLMISELLVQELLES